VALPRSVCRSADLIDPSIHLIDRLDVAVDHSWSIVTHQHPQNRAGRAISPTGIARAVTMAREV
jgi:hypothetical protein